MSDSLSWLSTIKDLSMSTALILLLYGGAKRWWAFGYQLTAAEQRERDCKADYEARLAAAQRREDEWKDLALHTGQVARTAVDLVKKRS